ncbi:MAG TPA: glycosyltransferase [Solirubrobacterales bacterium]
MAGKRADRERRSWRIGESAKRVAREKLPPRAVTALKTVRDLPGHVRALRQSTGRARHESAKQEVERLAIRPLISLVMPTYRTEGRYLRAAIDSVLAQHYPDWELCVVDDGSGDPALIRTLEAYATTDPRIRIEVAERNEGISAATNRGLALCTGEFVGFLDHDDALTPDALLRVVQALVADPELDVVYSDSDKLTPRGVRQDPFLKPDWSPVYALGAMYIGHLLIVRREVALAAGGFDSAFDKIQDFEFMLRVSERTDRIAHIPQVLYHWRSIPGSIAAGAEEKSGVPELQARAVNEHLRRRGIDLLAEPHPTIPHRAVLNRAGADSGPRRTSVVIAAERGGRDLARLLDSLPTEGATEVIVVTGPKAQRNGSPAPGVSVVELDAAVFNRARANNLGAAQASGELLVFVAEDCEIVEADWLERLAVPLEIPGVGAVGPLLVRPDGRVEEAGFAIGLHDMANPLSQGAPDDADGYYGSLPCAHEVSAVSSSCLLVPRADFEAVGGFNDFYAGQFDDFDLCERLAARGLSTVYAARPKVLTHRTPAASRAAVDIVDRALFVDFWYDQIMRGDPYFNPGFSRQRGDYSPAGWRERIYRATAPLGRR